MKNSRKEKLLSLCGDDKTQVLQLVDELVFLETQLEEIKKLPFYKVHPQIKEKQKLLPAGKIYKELLQQYNACLKLFAGITGIEMDDEETPLRKWAKEHANQKQKNMDAG